MSVLIALSGVFAEYLWWTKDWWRPETITGTKIGIEDVLLGFTNGGIAAVLYEEVFSERLYHREKDGHFLGAAVVAFVTFWAMYSIFRFYHQTSFLSTMAGLALMSFIVICTRTDLFVQALTGGVLMSLVVIPFFWILMWLSPGFVEHTWQFAHLSGIRLAGVPFEDVIFYFMVGFVTAPFYEYGLGFRLRKEKIHNMSK